MPLDLPQHRGLSPSLCLPRVLIKTSGVCLLLRPIPLPVFLSSAQTTPALLITALAGSAEVFPWLLPQCSPRRNNSS